MIKELVGTKDFDEIIKEHKVVLIDYFATWCAPCKLYAPELVKVSNEIGDKICILKIDIDEHLEIAEKFRIEAVPTTQLYLNQKLINTFQGFRNSAYLLDIIKKIL